MNGKKNEEYKESQITTINIFGFTFYMEKIYFTRKHNNSFYAFQDILNTVMIHQSLI